MYTSLGMWVNLPLRLGHFSLVLIFTGMIPSTLETVLRRESTSDWASLQMEYAEEVHVSAKKCNEIYRGTNAFRANYAERRYKELETKDPSDLMKKSMISLRP